MSITCPVKSLSAWKDLEKAVGEPIAYSLWAQYDGFVPEEFYKKENITRIKEGIDFVFEQNPELANIGNEQQYSQYLDSIFPDSKVKDIVYHNTNEQFDTFKIPFYAEDMYGEDAPVGIFFSTDKEYTLNYGERDIMSLINLKNPKFEKEIEYEKVAGYRLGKKVTEHDGFYGNDKIDLRDAQPSKGTEYVVFEPEQIHILGSKQDVEGFKQWEEATEAGKDKFNLPKSKITQLRNAIKRDLPKEVASMITIINKVSSKILGDDSMFFAMKDVFATNGITDPLLVNWAGINKMLFGGDPKNVKSTEQLEKLLEDTYNKKKDENNYEEFKSNNLASDSFKEWKKALKAYPLEFRDIMLTHATKYITDPNRESKYMIELSNVALSNTYGILVSKPHEANRLGKLYNEEVLKTVSDAVGHEPSASGKGYWVHIPKTEFKNFGYNNYNDFKSETKEKIKAAERSAIDLGKKTDIKELEKRLDELKNKKPIFKTQEPNLDNEDRIKYGYENFEYVRIESTYSRGNSYHQSSLGENYEGYYIHGYNTRKNQDTKIVPITKKQAESIWNRELSQSLTDETFYSLEVEDRQDAFRLQEEIKNYDLSRILERIEGVKNDILKYKYDLETVTPDGWNNIDIDKYNTNVELLRKLSPSTWCTSSGMAGHYVENYDNYILIVNGITVAGIEASTDTNMAGKRTVHEVTSRANNGVASIDHLDDTLAFFKKHNLDETNRTIVSAINSKERGQTDINFSSGNEYDYGDQFEIPDPPYDHYLEEAWMEIEEHNDLKREEDWRELEEHRRKISVYNTEQVLAEIEFDDALILNNFDALDQGVRDNERIARIAVDWNSHNVMYISRNLPFHRELVIKAVNNRPIVFEYLQDEDQNIEGLRGIYDRFIIDYNNNLPFSKANNLIQGYYDANNDKVVVVASNTSIAEASKVAIHEVAHRGMLRMAKDLGGVKELGKPLFAAEKQLMRKLPELLKRTGHTSLDNLMMDYGFTVDSEEGKIKLLMELSARWAETLINKPKPSWWKQLIGDISKWLTKFTGKTLTEQEVNRLIGGFVQYGAKSSKSTNHSFSDQIPSQLAGVIDVNTGGGNTTKKIPESKVVKEGVNSVFEQNPELANIGNKQQYSQYLDTIFPDSKVKDIVYHGSDKKFDSFRIKPNSTFGIYFSSKISVAKREAMASTGSNNIVGYNVLLNIKNPRNGGIVAYEANSTEYLLGYDSLLYSENFKNEVIVVTDPEQVHILGSKQDIEGFKKFTNSDRLFYSIDSNDKLKLKHFTDFIGLKKSTVSSGQKVKIAERTKKYNSLHGTGHFVKFTRLGESMNYTWSVDQKWNNYDPTQGTLFNQLESGKTVKEVNKELEAKIKQQLTELGITIESIDKFMDKYNVSPVGVADIVNGIIYIDADRANELTLPEETAHFIIELLGETPLAKRLLALVEANDSYVEILGNKFDEYNKLYKGDKNSLVREAAGKLLSQSLVSKFNEANSAIPVEQLGLIERLWKYAKTLFNKITKQRFNKDVADAYGITAEQFLKGQLTGLNKKNLTRQLTMFQISDKSLNNLRSRLDKSKEEIAKRINVYKRKDLKKLATREEETLSILIENLDNKQYLVAALNVSESARDRFVKVDKRITDLQNSVDNLELVGTKELLALSSTLRDMKSFTNSYLPMMKDIKLEMTKMLIEDKNNEEVKRVSQILSETIDKAELLENEYFQMARPIYQKFITPFIGSGPIEDLQKLLEEGGEDITFFQRWIDSLANSGEPMLQIIDVVVKDAKQEARDESYDIMKDLIAARMKLEESGIKDTKWTYEKKSDGTFSGNNVYEFNYGDWSDAKDKAVDDTLKRIRISNHGISLPESKNELLAEVFSNDVLRSQYGKLMNNWHKYNSQTNPNTNEIIAEKKKSLSNEDYNEWFDENTTIDEFTGVVYYKGELSSPAEKYRNKQYLDIMSNPAKKEFYDYAIRLKDDLDSKLPENRRLGRLAPQLRTDFIEKLKASENASELVRNAKESIREQFQNVEDDNETGDAFKVTDENGHPVNFLPIYFTGKLNNMKDLSTDFAEALSAFTTMTTDYSKMSKIVDMLELGRDIISNRSLVETDSRGNILKESINILGKKIARQIKKDPDASNLKARLDDYFIMNIYGKTRVEGVDWNILGYKINSEKALDMLGRYTSLNNLALNIYAGIQNPLVGNASIRLEAIAGQFFNNKSLLEADKKYYANLAQNMTNVGSRNPKDWLSLWTEKMEVMQDFSRKSKELNMDRKNLISKLFNQSALYFMSHAGEHQMQSRTSLALAFETKLKDKDGKDITLLDAFETVGNKFVLKSGLKKPDGISFTEADLRSFKRKQNAINNSIHGIYNDQDLLAIQQYGLLRQALMFRKFMRPGFNRRFRKKYYNYEGQFDVEGYYRTFGRFTSTLVKDLKHGQFLLAAHWNELTQGEKQNIIRTATEAGYMITVSLFLQFILPMIGGDDEDNWAAQMTAYQANRLKTELSFYIDPRQTMTILNSPAAGISQINKVLDLLSMATKPSYAMEEISKGRWEGYTRLHKASIGTIPFVKTITDWQSPETKLVFFTLQNK